MDEGDAALIAAICEGSELAFNSLIDRHQRAVRLFLRGVMAGPEDAEDFAQDTFLAVWRHADSYRGGSVRSWLLSIAWRKALDSRKRWLRRQTRDTAWHDLGQDTVSGERENVMALQQAMSGLPMDQRAAVMLCLGCGLTHTEAADLLRQPLGTVKSNVLRGRDRLRQAFGDE